MSEIETVKRALLEASRATRELSEAEAELLARAAVAALAPHEGPALTHTVSQAGMDPWGEPAGFRPGGPLL